MDIKGDTKSLDYSSNAYRGPRFLYAKSTGYLKETSNSFL